MGPNQLPYWVIADEGGGSPVKLKKVTSPNPVAEAAAEYGVELFTMRTGVDGVGYRAAQITGTSASFEDIELDVFYLEDSQFDLLKAKFFANPPILVEVTRYQPSGYFVDTTIPGVEVPGSDPATWSGLCVFQKNGWVPKLWPSDSLKKGATLRFHKLGEIA